MSAGERSPSEPVPPASRRLLEEVAAAGGRDGF
jgi:hypothetical protein